MLTYLHIIQMLLYLIVGCNILTYLHIIQMDMVKDEVIQKDHLSRFKKVSWDSSMRRWLCQQENIIMLHSKNLIETRNLK
jgi:hypothetical protein